ncbi:MULTISPECIES: GlsB/YeaQ/YmgE family stress response membrane protein [Nocardia]|uniref:Transglycosylase associated protein n=1 Tax=Nocardia farcinica TaxID=37329 RepID=A0A449HCV6_NOCFR|nr:MULTISPECIES: GlsB/YeaQ/YmgE family stress response membrane protein [Nocardia]MBF6140933.1 GlsB/YeaQ/YmgE family stress response membrane protein [Nocardia farcinica]MBF6184483.1 GlsB/YeaQ/YmgE family stress response membrane protein [Nocardia farcinica]MBF6255804.1 GlsB/YeaQ/YmgE family stress response membrane protein [Nocardia farcinica]MBF6310327.1 GlsB/YeaQ/YmgE family stress response membrane protein [Nocardia farcinica]MBF6405853.1 GlsB/YeaQ/YmgE family stress response membrane prot
MWNAIVQIVGFLIIGVIIGFLARALKPGADKLDFKMTALLGMAGALIGGIVASLIGKGSITELNFWGFVFAVVAAIALLFLAPVLQGKR